MVFITMDTELSPGPLQRGVTAGEDFSRSIDRDGFGKGCCSAGGERCVISDSPRLPRFQGEHLVAGRRSKISRSFRPMGRMGDSTTDPRICAG